MILTQHGINAAPISLIGGRIYKVAKIGSQIWLAENLDLKYPACDVGAAGTPSTPAAWYYNNDEANYGIDGTYSLGLLYNWYAVDYIETNKATLCPGWHVPTTTEWNAMIAEIGANPATPLKAQDDSVTVGFPSGWNGTDATEMGVLPGGRYNGSFGLLGTDGRYWTANSYAAAAAHDRRFTSNSSVSSNTNQKTVGYSLRLLKDT